MDVVIEAVARVVWLDLGVLCGGLGWYVMDAEVPQAGMVGPYSTKAAAVEAALGCGYTEVR